MDQAITKQSELSFSPALRVGAQIISYLAHPLFIPIYMTWILMFQHPINKLLLPPEIRIRILAMVFINTVLFPALIVFLLKRLGFIKSIYMETTKERIIPLTAGIIFYFWAFYVSRNLDAIPHSLQQWLLGVFLSSSAAMFVNIWKKISLHAIGVGGFAAFCAWQQATDVNWPHWWLTLSILIAGVVGTSRLIRKSHVPSDIYAGYLVALVCQVAAGIVYN